MPAIVDKPCRMCGEMMLNVSERKKYCKRCLQKRERMRRSLGFIPVKKRQPPPSVSVAEITAAADAAGMSYGKYVIWRMQHESTLPNR